MKQNICVFGIGGVGGYFGGKIAEALTKTADIYFIARGPHLEEIKKKGLVLKSDGTTTIVRPTLATNDPGKLPSIDICFICVKSYDLADALKSIAPKLNQNSVVIPLLNGVDIYERTRSILSDVTILPACVFVGTHIEKPGVVVKEGGGRIIVGADPQNKEFNPRPVIDLLKTAGLDYVWQENADTEIWTKFIFIAPFALVGSCYNKTLGQIMESEELKAKVVEVMKEVQAIADKKGIALDENIIDISLEKANGFSYETKTSLHRDIEASKNNELDLFGGTVVEMGKALNIPTPATNNLYSSIATSG